MDRKTFFGGLMALRGDDEAMDVKDAVYEVTDANSDGDVEIAFDLGVRADRVYVTIPLHEVMRIAAGINRRDPA